MGFSMEDVMEVIQIVKESKDTALYIDTGDIKLSLSKGKVSGTAAGPLCFSASATAPPAMEEAVQAPIEAVKEADPVEESATSETGGLSAETLEGDFDEAALHAIKASVTSVFYRRPSPEESPFVEIGEEVQEDSVLCLLEVMKCYRQVLSEIKGRVVKICVESNTLVKEGTTLFLIQPNWCISSANDFPQLTAGKPIFRWQGCGMMQTLSLRSWKRPAGDEPMRSFGNLWGSI